jgi:8-demethyl-8-(2-methoxy-alpha-L-rhamnosyl)tetracenomycin-C 3'-O-methyltransferase
MTLDEIALKHGTDKATSHHGYTRIYERYLEPLRDEPITLLELGWGGHEDPEAGGASAAMWRDYFPNATIVVIDVEPKTNHLDGVNFHEGSQADPAFLTRLHNTYGDFDVIVDDASHLSSLTITSWELLYPMLRPGGWYFLEDTHSSYHAHYYGAHEANPDPDKPRAGGEPTTMQYFKRLADEVNFKGRSDLDLFPAKHWRGYCLEMVAFYFNLAVVRKAA